MPAVGCTGGGRRAGDEARRAVRRALRERPARRRVRVNTIYPGPVATRIRRNAYPGESGNLHPAPAEVIAPFLYLLGPASKGVTGQAFTR